MNVTISDEERKNSNSSDRWMVHTHIYNTGTNAVSGHQHSLMGVSCPARLRQRLHVHRLKSRTTFSGSDSVPKHWHAYDILTDVEVEMPDGTHVHYFSGVTSTNAGHSHIFSGSTALAPDIGNDFESGAYQYKKCSRPEEDDE